MFERFPALSRIDSILKQIDKSKVITRIPVLIKDIGELKTLIKGLKKEFKNINKKLDKLIELKEKQVNG